MSDTRTIILFGLPGSGKGTQAKLLAEREGWTHFSTGDKFKELREGTGALNDRVREAYDAGKLMPDWFANYLFEDTMLGLAPEQGVVFDGYPRSLSQAEIFDDTAGWMNRPYVAINLAVPEEEALRRQIERAKTEHRPDSSDEEKVRARFATYTENTAPLLAYFREKGVLIEVDGTPSVEEIAKDIEEKLKSA